MSTKKLVRCAVVAAIYAVLCLVLALPLVLWAPEALGRRKVKEA